MFERLAAIRKKHGLDLVIPNLDFEIDRYQRLAPELDGIGVRTLLPSVSARRKLGKLGLRQLIGQHSWSGFEYPETLLVRTRADLQHAWERFGSPLMLKGLLMGAARLYSLQQAMVAWMRFKAEGDAQVLAQPAMFGEEFGVGVVCGRDGRMIDAIGLKKLVMCERGKTWGAIRAPLPQAIADLQEREGASQDDDLAKILRKVAWVGPADVEFIRDSLTEKLQLIEINPRFPAWIGFAGLLDVNLPRQLVLAAMERSPAAGHSGKQSDQNVVFMRTVEEIPASAFTMAAFVNRGETGHG